MEMPGCSRMLLVLLLGGERWKHPELHYWTSLLSTREAAVHQQLEFCSET
jgi:hypothetical protein